MTDDVVMRRVFVKEYYVEDSTAKDLLKMAQSIISDHGEEAEVYQEDDSIAVYINRPETEHEREVRLKNEERVKNYRRQQYEALKREFEPELDKQA